MRAFYDPTTDLGRVQCSNCGYRYEFVPKMKAPVDVFNEAVDLFAKAPIPKEETQ